MRRRFIVVLAAAAATAGAQAGPRGPRIPGAPNTAQPQYWVGLTYGLFELGTIQDGKSNTDWSFGYTTQIAATLEKTLQPGAALGIMMGFASPHMNYRGLSGAATTTTAKADVTQLMATARIGGGFLSLRSAFLLSGGAVQFGNFRDLNTSAKLPGGNWDPAFGTGYGLGYALTPATEIYFQSDFLFVLHNQGNTVQSFPPSLFTFKIGFRTGF